MHLGLIAITATRDELASVLAHEMSHVSQRHIARSISGESKRSLVGLAALVLGMLAASRSRSPDAMSAVVAGTQAATIQGQLNFSRDMEREADRVGFQVMTVGRLRARRHGGDVREDGHVDAPQRLRRLPLPAHPPADRRAHRRGARARRHRSAPRGAACSVLEHTVAQARARVLMDTRVDALRRWQARDADRDGAAADKLRALDGERARRRACCATGRAPTRRSPAALAIVRASPNSSARAERAVVLMQAQSLLDRGAPAQAAEAMKAYAGDGSRPSLLLDAQIALLATPGGRAGERAR